MPLSLHASLRAEMLLADARIALERVLTLGAEWGEVREVVLPDGTFNQPVLPPRTGQLVALLVTSDKAVQVCVGDVLQNQALSLGAGGAYALLGGDVPLEGACALSYTPGDGSVATCLVYVAIDAVGIPEPPEVPPQFLLVNAMGGLAGASRDVLLATGARAGEALPAQAPAWRLVDAGAEASLTWTPAVPFSGGGQGTALATFDFAEYLYVALRPTSAPSASEVWRLGRTAAEPAVLAFTLPAATTVTAMFDMGEYLFLGTSLGAVYRWGGTGAPELVAQAGGGQAVKALWRAGGLPLQAWIEAPTGLITLMCPFFGMGDAGTWEPVTIPGLTGTRCSNMVLYDSVNMIATGTEAGDRVDIWELTVDGATVVQSFTERSAQRPGPLWTDTNATTEQYLYVGRLSLTATPLLELWGLRQQSWSLVHDFQSEGDPNTSITAIHYVYARAQLYVATGTPFLGSGEGARVYALP